MSRIIIRKPIRQNNFSMNINRLDILVDMKTHSLPHDFCEVVKAGMRGINLY